MMNLLIWGAGAIGGSIGAYFSRAGHGVTFVDRVQDHVDAINRAGLRITGPMDGESHGFKFLERKMVRERNRVCHALIEAAGCIDQTLSGLKL